MALCRYLRIFVIKIYDIFLGMNQVVCFLSER